jgi:hypothetical protein
VICLREVNQLKARELAVAPDFSVPPQIFERSRRLLEWRICGFTTTIFRLEVPLCLLMQTREWLKTGQLHHHSLHDYTLILVIHPSSFTFMYGPTHIQKFRVLTGHFFNSPRFSGHFYHNNLMPRLKKPFPFRFDNPMHFFVQQYLISLAIFCINACLFPVGFGIPYTSSLVRLLARD